MARKKAPDGALANRILQPTFISRWREHRWLSQEVLASRIEELLGVSFTASTLSRIENGKSPYSQPQLEAFAEALSCTTVDLLSRDPDAPPMISMQGLPDGDAQKVAEYVKALRVVRERDPQPSFTELPEAPPSTEKSKNLRRKA